MSDEHKAMIAERERVSKLLAQAVSEITDTGGDIRFFSAALLTAAVQLHIEIEGPEHIDRAITKIGIHEMQRNGVAFTC
ncbi:hypothetical protein G5B39_10480 [Rhodobacteraceae bacterium SC52]|nr:hypothetical protein G5B39_10480 [Rhodobacteraceae bacterium SC52]